MEDILRYKSCRLYPNGRFRLPNSIRKFLLAARIKHIVIFAVNQGLAICPASRWLRERSACKSLMPFNHPVREFELKPQYISLAQPLLEHLDAKQKIYFQPYDDYWLIINENSYLLLNNQIQNELKLIQKAAF